MNPNRFYVYQLIDPRTNNPFYIGKGTGDRMNDHVKEARRCVDVWVNKIRCQMITDIENLGKVVIVEKIQNNMCETAALVLETATIQQYGKIIDGSGILSNISSGGTGCCAGVGGKTIQQYTVTGAILQSYTSLTIAAEDNHIHKSTICAALKKRAATAGGYRWGYDGEPPNMMPIKLSQVSVVQYNLIGNIINNYESVKKAAHHNNIVYTSIVDCCRGRLSTAGGYRWSYHGEVLTPVSSDYTFQSRRRKLHAINSTGEVVHIFSSATEAALAVGLKSSSGISDVCAGRKKKSGGYFWRWVD